MTDLRKRMQAAMSRPLPKRFYKLAGFEPVPGKSAWRIVLDGRPAKTPGKHGLELPTAALADALAQEWQAQAELIDPAHMRMTTLAFTAIDGVRGKETAVAAEIVSYAGTDLVCYRATGPDRLMAQQSAAWDPVIAWAAKDLGAAFVATTGLSHRVQPETAVKAVEDAIKPCGAFELAALSVMTSLTGSALLALAVQRGHMTAEAAWTAAHVDEDWQIAQWGQDDEAETRRAIRWRDMAASARMLECLRAAPAPKKG
jgi:chaperone required for assembly of F1-ATPase